MSQKVVGGWRGQGGDTGDTGTGTPTYGTGTVTVTYGTGTGTGTDRTETVTYGTDIVDSGTSSTVLANIIC